MLETSKQWQQYRINGNPVAPPYHQYLQQPAIPPVMMNSAGPTLSIDTNGNNCTCPAPAMFPGNFGGCANDGGGSFASELTMAGRQHQQQYLQQQLQNLPLSTTAIPGTSTFLSASMPATAPTIKTVFLNAFDRL